VKLAIGDQCQFWASKFQPPHSEFNTMARPKIHLEKEPRDRQLERLALILVSVAVAVPLFAYGQLPETIPIHFNSRGEPDGFGPKMVIWFLPALGGALYLALMGINRSPESFNYTVPITEENAREQYRIATRMIRWVNMLIQAVFVFLTVAIVMVALGRWQGLGRWFLPVFLVTFFGVIGYFVYISQKNASNKEDR